MNINFYMPVRVYSGKNCLNDNYSQLLKMGWRCFIVSGKTSARLSGALDDVLEIFCKHGISYQIFNEIESNPLTSTCKKAGELARAFEADYILGIGGGSVLDATKAVALFCENPFWKHSDIYERTVPSFHKPVALIGTTAGTGSEVTGVSVLTNSETGIKKSISGLDCYADIAFCDYTYTLSALNDVRISTALDAFCHAVEAYLSNADNETVNIFSLNAISLLAPYILNKNFNEHSENDFEKIYIASIYAGYAINTAGTLFPHTVGYYLTESHNIPHGKACAVFMPTLLERAKKYCPEKLGTILSTLNCELDCLVSEVNSLCSVDVSYSEEDAAEVSLRWINGVKNFDRSPGGFSYKDAEQALKSLIS